MYSLSPHFPEFQQSAGPSPSLFSLVQTNLVGSPSCPVGHVEDDIEDGYREADPPVTHNPGPTAHQLIDQCVDCLTEMNQVISAAMVINDDQ
jgi:hypothetical protein